MPEPLHLLAPKIHIRFQVYALDRATSISLALTIHYVLHDTDEQIMVSRLEKTTVQQKGQNV